MDSTVICERCGQRSISYRGYLRHKRFCAELPTPDELIDEWERDDISQDELAARYETNRNVIRDRMKLSSRYEAALKEKRQKSAKKLKKYNGPKQPVCKCGLLLSHPAAQPVYNGQCKWCYMEAHGVGYRDLFPFEYEDVKRFVPEYV